MTAYQVSLKGLQLLEVMGDDLQEMADKVLFNPPDQQDDKHLMQVVRARLPAANDVGAA